jgi:spore maturation protein CgeB
VTLAGLDEGLDYVSSAMIPRFDLYLSFSGGPVPGMIEDVYGSPMARTLYCSADLDLYRQQPQQTKWLLGYLGTYSKDRQPQLEKLLLEPARELTSSRFVVAGSQYPDHLRWSTNVERIQHLPPHEHSRFYAEQRFTLNVTRADMRALGFSPSVRLFEAAACGAPIISDRWPGIETIFAPSSEILLVASATDVIEIISEMSEDKRRSIAEQARLRVLRDHTPAHRARQLESYYLEAASRRLHLPSRDAAKRPLQTAEM